MLNEDSDSLKCDLAETYGIYDMRSLPPTAVAVFAYGLGENSRIQRKLSGMNIGITDQLLASIADGLNLLIWSRSKPGTERPQSILAALIGAERQETKSGDSVPDRIIGFADPESFREKRKEILEGGGGDG